MRGAEGEGSGAAVASSHHPHPQLLEDLDGACLLQPAPLQVSLPGYRRYLRACEEQRERGQAEGKRVEMEEEGRGKGTGQQEEWGKRSAGTRRKKKD